MDYLQYFTKMTPHLKGILRVPTPWMILLWQCPPHHNEFETWQRHKSEWVYRRGMEQEQEGFNRNISNCSCNCWLGFKGSTKDFVVLSPFLMDDFLHKGSVMQTYDGFVFVVGLCNWTDNRVKWDASTAMWCRHNVESVVHICSTPQ